MIGNVVWTIADRPHYTKQALESWQAVRDVDLWNHVFCVEPGPQHDAQIDVIMTDPFPFQQVIRNPRRMGVLGCAWNALSTGFNGKEKYGVPAADFCVLAEEDLIVSDDVLELFDRLSEELLSDPVGAICMSGYDTSMDGWTFQDFVRDPDRFDSHIWGTWKHVWMKYLRDTWDFDYSSGDPSGWDWNMTLRVFPQNRLHSVRPRISRSDNIGQYGGVHQNPDQYEASRPPEFTRHVPMVMPILNGPAWEEMQ